MAEKKAIQEAIEDLKFMANKQRNPLERIAFNMAITICEQHLPKERLDIEAAVNEGMCGTMDAKEYFNKTFTQNK